MRNRYSASVAAGLLITPSVALAHLVNSGLGPFYDGALHLLLSPGDLLGLVAAALLAGLRGAQASRLTVIALPTTWLLSGLLGLNLPVAPDLAWLSMISLLILGGLVAANLKIPPMAVAALASLHGALHGMLNGSALAAIGAGTLPLFGIVATALTVVLLVSAMLAPLKAAWTRVAVQVAGSWVVAVGILMIGWFFRGAV